MKICSKWSWSHDPRGLPCPYMVQNLLQNQKTDDLGTWYVAICGHGVIKFVQMRSKLDLDLLNVLELLIFDKILYLILSA